MPNDLDTITRLEKKIEQLPPILLTEVENYVNQLLQQPQASELSNLKTSDRSEIIETEISDAEIEAVCGLYQADCTVSLEKMEEAIMQGALNGRY